MGDIRETQNRLGRAATYGRGGDDDGEEGIGRGRSKTEQQLADRKERRKPYQFEATGSDDEMEDELDDNLDEIGDATKTLKALSMAMGQELNVQNSRIGRIEEKTVNLDNRVFRNTERVGPHRFVTYLSVLIVVYPAQEDQVVAQSFYGRTEDYLDWWNIYTICTESGHQCNVNK